MIMFVSPVDMKLDRDYRDEEKRELLQLDGDIRGAAREGDMRRLGFLEGRGFEITKGMDEHPEWWDRACQCDLCNSYGE